MGILDKTSNFVLNQTTASIYGAFNKSFDQTEFERDREDGVTILDLTPDCRIFVSGAEITADVDNVNVSHSTDGSKCTLTLNNPRGRYEITRMDLMKKWREDKDILATYNYEYIQKQNPLNWDNLAQKIGTSTLGAQAGNYVGKSIDLAKQGYDTIGGLVGTVPKIRGLTRMLFETKFYSGISRRIGDIVFDYRDPVMVFMKGRFSPYWYFVFTGIVVSYSDVDAYGDSNKITLNCEDTLSIWKRTKLLTQAAFYSMSNLENRILNTNTKTKSIVTDFGTNMTFLNMIKCVAFSADYGQNAYNCHITKARDTKKLIDIGRKSEYDRLKNLMHKGAKIDKDMKVTSENFLTKLYKSATESGEPSGTIGASTIQYKDDDNNVIFKNGPNDYPLSPAAAIYFQLNDLSFAAGSFDGKTINRALDLSVRYWEHDHEVKKSFDPENAVGTGWKDKKAFGICGVNPAMKYAFIDNFNILEKIWSEYYNKGSNSVENCVMTLYDRVYETVIGSPTEMILDGSHSSSNATPIGTNLNLFRPRLFVLSPNKYAGIRKLSGNFQNLGKLFEESATTYYEFLKTKLRTIEYNMFSSPCGDVFIEPDLYDFHPLEFSEKIESRSIVKLSDDIEFTSKATINLVSPDAELSTSNKSGDSIEDLADQAPTSSAATTKSETVGYELASGDMPSQPRMVKVAGTAYMFNPKANHPYFIMEKDRIRNTYEFSVDKIVSMVEVNGGKTMGGGVLDAPFNTPESQQFINSAKAMTEGNAKQVKKGTAFNKGRYIADGFDALTHLGPSVQEEFENERQVSEELLNAIKNYAFIKLVTEDIDITISDLVITFASAIDTIKPSASKTVKDYQKNWNTQVQSKVNQYLASRDDANKFDDTTAIALITEFGKNIKAAAGIAENSIDLNQMTTKILDKKVSDFVLINKKTKAAKDKEFEDLVIEISKLKTKKDTVAKGGLDRTPDSDVDLVIREAYEEGIFSFDSSTESKSVLGSMRGIVSDIVLMYEGSLIGMETDSVFSKMAKDLDDFEKNLFFPRQFRAMTMADLRKFQKNGYYNPRENLIALYGYKRMEPITNEYIRADGEADTYARHIFNRILGDSRSINTTIIGRPEFQLNRPYYFERKDCIGLLQNFNISYKYGSEFTSTATLRYIRNNTLSYDYSLGDLDAIKGDHNNDYFAKEGRTYLQYNNTQKNVNKKIGTSINKAIGGTAGSLVGGGTEDILDTIQLGGLYSAHDFLGHMNYDDRGSEPVVTVDDNTSGTLNKLFPPQNSSTIVDLCKRIENAMKALKELEDDLKILNDQEKKDADDKVKQANTDITQAKTEASKTSTQADRVKALLKIKKLQSKLKKEELILKNIEAKIILDNQKTTNYQNALYGLLLAPARGGKSIVGENQKLTSSIRRQYVLTKDSRKEQYGLFYCLFCTHLATLGITVDSEDYPKLEVCCDNPEGVGTTALFKGVDNPPSTSLKYYIKLSE